MSTTDALKRAMAEQLEALRPIFDGVRKPNGFRIHGLLAQDGTLKELVVEPSFKVHGERR